MYFNNRISVVCFISLVVIPLDILLVKIGWHPEERVDLVPVIYLLIQGL